MKYPTTLIFAALFCSTAAAAPEPVTCDSPCDCHNAHGEGRWSVKTDASLPPTNPSAIGCAKCYCALTSVWRTSSHFPLFFTQTLALLYVPDMSLPSKVSCIVVLYLVTATSALGKTTFMSANEKSANSVL